MVTRMNKGIFFLQCLSPLHVGSGNQSDYIDLPISRERATRFPNIPGSAVKGVWREEFARMVDTQERKQSALTEMFGPDANNAAEHAGAINIGDASILTLPIASLAGCLAYVTCPMVMARFARDHEHFASESSSQAFANPVGHAHALVPENSVLLLKAGEATKVILEDFDLQSTQCAATKAWATALAERLFLDDASRRSFISRFCVVSDDVFCFLSETGTEVRTRVRIDPSTRTVVSGALWTEESVPAEAIFWGGMEVSRPKSALTLADFSQKKRLQIGGNATIGNGQVLWSMPK
jgi:CRISPR-associated protein Cmr4